MSKYYKPHRKTDWNYGGPNWRLSRSKIDLFVECKRCFYVDNKLGTARPPGFPFSLNAAVDRLLKKEFDGHRTAGTPHPLMKAYKLELVPFKDPRMDVWRENFKGVQTEHTPTGFTVSGAIDDLWVDGKGTVYVVDYKATAKDGEVSLDADWQDGYKRQMEIYQWLLRENGLRVSDTGYFVYVNGRTDREAFNGKLEFDAKIIPYVGSADWLPGVLADIKKCLVSDVIPETGPSCDYCTYREAAGKALTAQYSKTVTVKTKKQSSQSNSSTPSLF
ncbi:MAG: PD-(D/E)XK nuclease family protein [Patescibacteria group bacterium]